VFLILGLQSGRCRKPMNSEQVGMLQVCHSDGSRNPVMSGEN